MLSRRSWQTGGVSVLIRHTLGESRLYLVCDALPDKKLSAALRGGVDLVQLRMKDASDADVLAAAQRFRAICSEHGVPLILNDRPDLAVLAGADGVHIGQDDMSVAQARSIVGPRRLVGLSTHTPEQVDAAFRQDVDYIGVGPVYATPTKPGRPAVGVDLIAHAAADAPVPFFAIGGIDATNLGMVVAAGARRVAVVRAITGARDPERAAAALRTALSMEVGLGAA